MTELLTTVFTIDNSGTTGLGVNYEKVYATPR